MLHVLRNVEKLITPSNILLDKTESSLTLADIGAQHVDVWHLLKRSEFCGSNKPKATFERWASSRKRPTATLADS